MLSAAFKYKTYFQRGVGRCAMPMSSIRAVFHVHRSFPASSNFGRLCAIRPCIFGASSLTSLRRRCIPSGAYVKDSRGIACSTKSRIIERPGSGDSRAGNGERCELPQRRGRATRKSQLGSRFPASPPAPSSRRIFQQISRPARGSEMNR